jgi:hypothetical protein
LPDEAQSAELVIQMRNPAFHNLLIAEDEARSAEFVPILAIPPCMTFLIAE